MPAPRTAGPAFFFCGDFCYVEQVETVPADEEENLPSEEFAQGVAWDLVRFDRDGKVDTISTVRQQNSHKEITHDHESIICQTRGKTGKRKRSRKVFARWAGFGATRARNNRLVQN